MWLLTIEYRRTTVPCWRSNFSHQAHESPKSGFVTTARLNHCLAFSILRSAQNNLATVQMINGSSADFFRASTDRDFRVGRGSAHIDKDQSSPDVGQSWRPVKKMEWFRETIMI